MCLSAPLHAADAPSVCPVATVNHCGSGKRRLPTGGPRIAKATEARGEVPKAEGWQTVTIFDWDDTLMCTSYLHNYQDPDTEVPTSIQEMLRSIEQGAMRLLELALAFGQTFIITNATADWVSFSAAKFMPKLVPVLERVSVISARSRFEGQVPDALEWKNRAFLEVQNCLDAHVCTNLVSIGDSSLELEAARGLGRALGWEPAQPDSMALVKTVKLKERPSAEELRKQLEAVAARFEQIVCDSKDLQIGLERRWTGQVKGVATPVAATAA